MNENLDLMKILDGCPKETEFYNTVYGKVKFLWIDFTKERPIVVSTYDDFIVEITNDGKLISTSDGECTLFPSKDQRDWSKFERFWGKLKVERFDSKTFQPFDKILVRNEDRMWYIDFFVCFDEQKCVNCISDRWDYCIPYNEDTKHLLCTKDDCPEYYKWWKE